MIPGVVLVLLLGAQQVRDPKLPPPATSQQVGTGSIAGVIVSAESGRPLKRATVELGSATLKAGRSVETDGDGQFRFTGLPPGEYRLAASKGGYVETLFGQRVPGSGRPGTNLSLEAGQELTRLSLSLVKGGVITGIVVDETGEPAFETYVRALRWVMRYGERTLQPMGAGMTDDRGVYRIPGLLPGEYVVTAAPDSGAHISYDVEGVSWTMSGTGDLAKITGELKSELKSMAAYSAGLVPNGTPTGFATLYFPGTTRVPDATSVRVVPGAETAGINFQLQLVPLARVSGTVTGPDGPSVKTNIRLVDRGQAPGSGNRSASADRDGRFVMAGVAPGQYTLVAQSFRPNAAQVEAQSKESMAALMAASAPDPQALARMDQKQQKAAALQMDAALNTKLQARESAAVSRFWATADVFADGRDLADVSLVLQPALSASGRIEVEPGPGAPPDFSRLLVSVRSVGAPPTPDWDPGPAGVDADGRFTIRGIFPGRYRLVVSAGMPSGYTLKSAIFGGQDVLDVPLEFTGNGNPSGGVVTLTPASTEVSGVAFDATSQPARDATIIVFAAEERFWLPDSRRIQSARPSAEGRFAIKGLPPGTYRIVAVDDVENGRWFDPVYLRTLGGFSTFTLSDNGKVTQDVRVR